MYKNSHKTDIKEIWDKKLERVQKGENPRVLDLFAGAGGLSLGFHTAGAEIVAAIEKDEYAAKTHSLNFFNTEEKQKLHGRGRDIVAIEPEELMQEFGYNEPEMAIDIIIGGPPCQAFARVGRAKLREVADHPEAFLKDARANLYLRFLHYVRQLKPLVILMENVPDALNHGGHNIAEETCEVLSSPDMDYTCGYTLLNSAYYAVPQMRERMFLLAYARELCTKIVFPEPITWLELPQGYNGSRSVALKFLKLSVNGQMSILKKREPHYIPLRPPEHKLPHAITAQDALGDLPFMDARKMLRQGLLKRGVQDPMKKMAYPENVDITEYDYLMRNWRGFKNEGSVTGHIIRYLPRDYKLFAELNPGDQYPQVYQHAVAMFKKELKRRRDAGKPIQEDTEEYENLRTEYVPPYDPGKFPNKWRKMEPDQPARTVMAHIGKDSYSHIHYDSKQARTISVREAARLQSFPDGFIFAGKMNAAFRQIGNAVPPLLGYYIASKIKKILGQKAMPLI